MISRRFLSFAVVGAVGFLVDAGILSLLVHGHDWGSYSARLMSFSAAVTVTWLLNRTVTFQSDAERDKGREYRRYFMVQGAGSLLNLLVYSLCIALFPLAATYPVMALAGGSIVAMMFNYLGVRQWVFVAESSG